MRSNANAWISHNEPAQRSKSKGKKLPLEVIRKFAMESSAGGRATCCKCHHTFSMNYMQLVRTGPFTQDHACADCRREFNLRKA